MKKTIFLLSIFSAVFFLFGFLFAPKISAQTTPTPPLVITPQPELCEGGCPSNTICSPPSNPADPTTGDVWVRDDEVTSLWKGGERSRQFLYWVLTHPSIDNHPTILWVWGLSRNIVYFLLLLTAIFMGIGIIVSQRQDFNLKIEISPLLIKLFLLLLYATFSATIILLIIQISDIMMQFFIKTLGGDKLFNIFGIGSNTEQSYRQFVGCRNINRNNVEMVKTSMFLIRFTNMTYYLLGIMVILRKIILWFLLIVSPFLAILMPYVFIRNIGWIWIGVFFQWVFYGPLFGLFLGGLAKIWNAKDHIPYIFDFSRRNKLGEIVYPTSINILYGGPAQKLEILNTSNYVDTFAEYVISLIMLWAVVLLPWWLLRIFRDYCCDGILAMKNILMAMYDNFKTGGLPPPPPPTGGSTPTPTSTTTGMARKMPEEREAVTRVKLETIQEIKRTRTEEINKVMQISATKLTDIARFETNKEQRQTVTKNLEYLQNPMRAQTPTERQKFMNLRTELFDRAVKGDVVAKQTLSSISASKFERQTQQEKLIQTIPQMVPVVRTTSIKVGLPVDKTSSVVKSIFNSISQNTNVVNNISSQSNTSSQQTQSILNAMTSTQNLAQPAQTFITNIAQQTGIDKEKVKQVIKRIVVVSKEQKELIKQVAEKENLKEEVVGKVLDSHLPSVAEPERHIEDTVTIPPTVSIEDYEEVKNMWADQYEKGEVPVSENIKDRSQWLETDTIAITNILNKLLSTDAKLKAQGLEDVAYIIPLFMINNLKGEELTVYLKAKLEAAKQVARDLEKEKEIKEKMKVTEEEVLVDAPMAKKKEEEKVMEMKKELKPEIPNSLPDRQAGKSQTTSNDQNSNDQNKNQV